MANIKYPCEICGEDPCVCWDDAPDEPIYPGWDEYDEGDRRYDESVGA